MPTVVHSSCCNGIGKDTHSSILTNWVRPCKKKLDVSCPDFFQKGGGRFLLFTIFTIFTISYLLVYWYISYMYVFNYLFLIEGDRISIGTMSCYHIPVTLYIYFFFFSLSFF